MAFILSAMIVVVIYGVTLDGNTLYYIAGFAAAIVGGIVEAYSKKLKVDDNLSIPTSVSIVMLLIDTLLNSTIPGFLHMI